MMLKSEYESQIAETINQFNSQPFYKRLFKKPNLKEIEERYESIFFSLDFETNTLLQHVTIWKEKPNAAYNTYTQTVNLLKKNGFKNSDPIPEYYTRKEENSYTATLMESRVIEFWTK